jgi:hypothetical protein
MKSIVLLFWRICIFRSGPDAVPASNTFTAVVIALNALVNIIVQLMLGADQVTLLLAVTLAIVSLAGTGALVWFVMMLMGLVNRVQQTITAIFGTDIIMTILTSIAFAATGSISETVAIFAITLLTLWSLMIYGFIFHRAMNIHIGFGIAIALFVVIFSVAITQTALGNP